MEKRSGMMEATIQEAFSLGQYTDKRKRQWSRVDDDHLWVSSSSDKSLTDEFMELLITRDLHRAECPGLYNCSDHPVPFVWNSRFSHNFRISNAGYTFEKFDKAVKTAVALSNKKTFNYTSPFDKEQNTRIFSEFIPKQAVPALINVY